ncbi:MAG: hypothetical protein JNL32_15845, partial [Candidatus Kapabacteria bacterium]|nr:hypothetical protein [Candidatus Kapabacteria bacterium]
MKCINSDVCRRCIVLALLILPMTAFAQLRISLVNGAASVDGSKYPLLSARVRATLNNQPFTITKDNSLIIEDNYSTSVESVSEQGGNEYIIRWTTRNRQSQGVGGRIVAFQGNTTGTAVFSGATGLGPLDRVPQIRFNNSFDGRINFLNIGKVTPGTTFRGGVRVIALSGKADTVTGVDLPVRIDSITNRSPYYKINWLGGPENNGIPGLVYPSLGYVIEILFTP